jgi:NAD-dependent SIR2 family protein deacetylase
VRSVPLLRDVSPGTTRRLIDIAIDAGATTVQVNPNPTDLDASVTVAIRGPSGTVLPELVSETWGLL